MGRNRLKWGWGNKSFSDLIPDYFKTMGITENTPKRGAGEQDTQIF